MFDGVRLGREVPKARDRRPWPAARLTALLASPAWSGTRSRREDVGRRHEPGPWVHHDADWWLPIIALHTGMRLEEIAQLRCADLARDGTGLPFIRVHDEGGNQVKNANSIRHVPVHPFLAGLGFLDLFEGGGARRLFPDLTWNKSLQRWGADYSERFTRYRKRVGLYERLMDFHSFRHTFITAMRTKAKVDIGAVAAIVGHDDGPDVKRFWQTNEYTDYDIGDLAEAVARLDYAAIGVDLSPLTRSQACGPRGSVRVAEP